MINSPMNNITSWNVRGLNSPNKQKDVKIFLHQQSIGLVGLLETKIKDKEVEQIASNIFEGSLCSTERIWVALKSCSYAVVALRLTDQLIHCAVTHLATQHHFHITFVYGHNQEHQKKPLWKELHQISLSISGAWCILRDFDSILFKEDRYGGNEVEDHDIRELTYFMADCKVLEMLSSGEYFS